MVLYFDAAVEKAERGQPFTQKELAKEIGAKAATISIWRRDDAFLREYARRLRAVRQPETELALLAITRRAMQGSSKHGEMVLRMNGLWEPQPLMDEGRDGVPSVQVGVAFYGLPAPPTPQEAERLRPPSGAVVVSGNGSGGNGSGNGHGST